jgi:glycosyltransferase involved in cell wall biosynthesis
MHPQITVATPSLPYRSERLVKALRSVARQTLPAAAISVAIDVSHAGAAATRQRALDAVQTEWVAFLDDDDLMKVDHLAYLWAHAQESGADYVYSYFDMLGGTDPFGHSGHEFNQFDPANPTETTITTLVRTELAQAVGFKPLDRGHDANSGEDYGFTLGCIAAGAKISHAIGRRTWFYVVHNGPDGKLANTSGMPNRGDALRWSPAE